jgi:DNA-directed RNA polymerase sigma subunit (sigma70/sigma32)
LIRAREAVESRLQREACVSDLAEETGLSESDVVEALAVPSHHPLDHAEPIPDASVPDALETAARHERQATVRKTISLLPDLERRVLELRFGFEGPRCSLDECGQALGFGRARAQNLETAALARV